MFDRYFSPALAFSLLLGGTLAVGSEMFDTAQAGAPAAVVSAQAKVIQLPTVVITARRGEPASAVACIDDRDAVQARVQ